MQRRLAAILAADVAGYSRLMGSDEIGTLKSLKAHRRELLDATIADHHGRTQSQNEVNEQVPAEEQLVSQRHRPAPPGRVAIRGLRRGT